MKTGMCKTCEKHIFDLLHELSHEAKKVKRGTLILDAIADLEVAIEEGNINKIVARDREYQRGHRVGRKLRSKKEN